MDSILPLQYVLLIIRPRAFALFLLRTCFVVPEGIVIVIGTSFMMVLFYTLIRVRSPLPVDLTSVLTDYA